MDRVGAKTAMSKLIDVFRKEYPNGGAFAAIHATGGHSLINKIYDAHEAELKAKDERIAELEALVQKMKCCENCSEENYNRYIDGGCVCVDFCNWRLKDNK